MEKKRLALATFLSTAIGAEAAILIPDDVMACYYSGYIPNSVTASCYPSCEGWGSQSCYTQTAPSGEGTYCLSDGYCS
jgi:hypothetical protein